MSVYRWQFVSRFRRGIFGWRSQIPIKRIKEAITEIRKVARKEPLLAAEGAVIFLEKISPSLEHVDSSTGAIGTAVNNAIEMLVPIIIKAPASYKERQKWLERLWEALQNDAMPYIENLGDFWGELCVIPELASCWADEFITVVKHIWSPQTTGHDFFKGTIACLSSLYSAKRYDELLELLDKDRLNWWYYRRWGIKALIAMNRLNEALKYAESSDGLNAPKIEIALTCEGILIAKGLIEKAYDNYALEANQKTTNLATFRAITKKYPNKKPLDILKRLIANQPGEEGKWFAAAKNADFFELAIELVDKSPADPRTLARAAKEFAVSKPEFAISSGIASLRWIIHGYGYEISNVDVLAAYSAITKAAEAAKISESEIEIKINGLLLGTHANTQFVEDILMPYLTKN